MICRAAVTASSRASIPPWAPKAAGAAYEAGALGDAPLASAASSTARSAFLCDGASATAATARTAGGRVRREVGRRCEVVE